MFGVVGLGRMGGNLAIQAVRKGIPVAGYSKGKIDPGLKKAGVVIVKSLEELKKKLPRPAIIFIYIPAGPVLDTVITELCKVLKKGDIIVDGGNSYWGDSINRAKALKKKGIFFIDLGTSGGVTGAVNGACFMAGGDKKAVARIEPFLKKLAVKDGYVYAGPSGSGHFIKLVHNGIEFGMLQAIGEGVDLLEHFHNKLDIQKVLHCWRNGSVIRSWLIELMEEQYILQKGMKKVPAFIEDTGEVNWLVGDALRMEVPIPAISSSINQLFASRDKDKKWAKAIAMMRHGFGSHPFGSDNMIVQERKEGRVGDIFRG